MQYRYNRLFPVLLIALFSIGLTSCSKNNNEGSYNDPIEGVNRATMQFNEMADKAVLEPIAKGYRRVTPEAGRKMVANFLRNLNSPVIIGNELLQGDFKGAGNATARVIINTLAGFGGLFDFAADGGIEHQPEDFGQTLAVWGLDEGMYVVLPLLGPSTLRDVAGRVVESYTDPLQIYLFNIEEEHLHYTRVGATVISQREELIEALNDLRANSFDYYAAVRSAYYQRREAMINDANSNVAIPDYDDF